MQREERDAAHLWDMLQAANDVVRFIEGLSLEQFLADATEITRLAVERRLEVLGEAARRISSPFQEQHPDIPWRDIVGLRNVISHEYDRVNYKEIYRIVRERMPALIQRLATVVPPPPEATE
jgi:uncharacterized protein with HEPN domain